MAQMIKRDPFAREELWRERETVTSETCSFCGQAGHIRYTRDGIPTSRYLYRFYVELDNGHTYYDRHKFCSRKCRKDWSY